jgi:hypothetical protein
MAAEQAGHVIGNPLSGQFHTKELICFQVVGIPCAPDPMPHRERTSIVRVLHAPSKPSVKGTDRIREAVESARASGYDLDYRELVGVPNHAVRDALLACDLVVDQCYSDTTMAGFAAEAAEGGIASMFGAFGASVLASAIPPEGRPPAICVDPDQFAEALAAVVADPDSLRVVGRAAHEFVSTAWARSAVASRFVTILTDGPPDPWVVEPDTLDYLWGCGVTREETVRRTAAVLTARGEGGLALRSQPRLRAEYVRAAVNSELLAPTSASRPTPSHGRRSRGRQGP